MLTGIYRSFDSTFHSNYKEGAADSIRNKQIILTPVDFFAHVRAGSFHSLTLNKEHAMIKDFQNMPKGVNVISWR